MTRTVTQVDDYHGVKVADPYRWLENVTRPDVDAWVDAQNHLTEKFIHAIPQRSYFLNDLRSEERPVVERLPFVKGGRWFQFRRPADQDQAVLYTGSNMDAIDIPLIEPNALSANATEKLSIPWAVVSEDGRWVAFGEQTGGSDWIVLRVVDAMTGEMLADKLLDLRFALPVWDPKNAGFYYVHYERRQPEGEVFGTIPDGRIRFHRLGTSQTEDLEIFSTGDNSALINISAVTDNGNALLLGFNELPSTRNERIGKLFLEGNKPRIVEIAAPDRSTISLVGDYNGELLAITYYQAPNGRVIAIDPRRPQAMHWRDVVPESSMPIGRFSSAYVDSGLAVTVHEHIWEQRIRVTDIASGSSYEVDTLFPGRLQDAFYADGIKFLGDGRLLFRWQNFAVSDCLLSHDLAERRTTLAEKTPPFDASNAFVVRTLWSNSADGTRVPVTHVSLPEARRNGKQPTLVYAYGHVGIPAASRCYRPEWASWIRAGGSLAIVHARGGGELGENWYQAAYGVNKMRTFEDCIGALEQLIEVGWTRPDKLAFTGASGGGLTTGVVLTQRPDLLAAAVPEVGLYDMLRYHHFTYTPNKEVGVSSEPEEFRALYSYSPQHAVSKGVEYPAVLCTAGEFDNRVHPNFAYKFVAALQAAQKGHAPILLRLQRGAGHGTVHRRDRLHERADVLAFLASALNLAPHA